MSSELESTILCRELGKLAGPIAGIGARWAARRLPSVAHEIFADTQASAPDIFRAASFVLRELGKAVADFPLSDASDEISAIVGSGIKNMNPTLVRVCVTDKASGASLHIRAVAKEGAISQRSAELAVENFMAILRVRLPNTSLQARQH